VDDVHADGGDAALQRDAVGDPEDRVPEFPAPLCRSPTRTPSERDANSPSDAARSVDRACSTTRCPLIEERSMTLSLGYVR
jgi:hypothetical protein